MGTFEIRDDFYLNGEKFQVISGSIHYFRVVPEYWHDRLLKLRNMGCNTVETYIPWNFHEEKQGQYDVTGRRDIVRFIKTAQELGLYVIIRPAPYICAEWEFGGFPAWLLKEDGMRFRCCEGKYLNAFLQYFDHLLPLLAPLQITHGGPIIMMQVENEYGSYGDDTRYLETLRDAMRARGIDVPLVTSDGPEHDMMACGKVEGVHQTGNFGSHTRERFDYMASLGIKPLMCMEFWCGWFDHWGCGGHAHTDAASSAKDFAEILDRGHVNIYMFHGGTSFGWMNGANDYDKLTPDVTSYDYDALLTEDGRETEKYRLFKAEIEKRNGPVAQTPVAPIPVKSYGEATMTSSVPLLSLTNKLPKTQGVCPVSMERLGQNYGYTLYHTTLTNEETLRKLQLVNAADRAIIMIDGQHVLTLYDRELQSAYTFSEPLPVRKGASLDILVENLGRVNYSFKLEHQRKGIDSAVVINDHQKFHWEMTVIDEDVLRTMRPEGFSSQETAPSVHTFTFHVDEKADTFLDVSAWGKGTVLLNGFNLGRFWEIGPQKRLYIPAPLLREGENELLILETEGKWGKITLESEPDLG